MRRVLVNLARRRHRARRVAEAALTESVHATTAGDPADAVVDRAALRQALAALPRRQREVAQQQPATPHWSRAQPSAI